MFKQMFEDSTKKSPAVHQMLLSAKAHVICHVIPCFIWQHFMQLHRHMSGTEKKKCSSPLFEGWTTLH